MTELSGTTDIGDLADKAVSFFRTTEQYKESRAYINKFTGSEFDGYISDGKIIPKFTKAYPDDYDGDGKKETFIVLESPYFDGMEWAYTRKYFIFADSGGNMTYLENIPTAVPVRLLDYGREKQIIFGGTSPYAVGEEHYSVYGVINGQVKLLDYSQRGYEKDNCFLRNTDRWWVDALLHYDQKNNRYETVAGKEVDASEVRKMDKAGNIKIGFDRCFLVGNKFYVMYSGGSSLDTMNISGTYTYENGEFASANFWLRTNWENEESADIDYDEAVASMVKY